MDILIIDDHALFASGLTELLLSTGKGYVVHSSASYALAKRILDSEPPKLVLLDLDLGDECGIEISKQIVQNHPNTKVAILSANEDVEIMKRCVLNGVVGYITKSSPPESFINAVQLLLKDGSYFPSHLLPSLLNQTSEADKPEPPVILEPSSSTAFTPRQQEVLSYLKQGLSNKVIARQMGISEGTVKLHVSTILSKLGVANRSAAIVKAS